MPRAAAQRAVELRGRIGRLLNAPSRPALRALSSAGGGAAECREPPSPARPGATPIKPAGISPVSFGCRQEIVNRSHCEDIPEVIGPLLATCRVEDILNHPTALTGLSRGREALLVVGGG